MKKILLISVALLISLSIFAQDSDYIDFQVEKIDNLASDEFNFGTIVEDNGRTFIASATDKYCQIITSVDGDILTYYFVDDKMVMITIEPEDDNEEYTDYVEEATDGWYRISLYVNNNSIFSIKQATRNDETVMTPSSEDKKNSAIYITKINPWYDHYVKNRYSFEWK